MQRLALVLMLIVSLLLPSFGSMAVAMPAEPCPMQSQEHGMHASVDMPCCEDMADSPGSKAHCKSGLECKTGGLLHIVLSKPLLPFSSPHPAMDSQPLLHRERIPLWRPPRVC